MSFAMDFIKKNLFVLLGAICIIIVGVIYLVARPSGTNIDIREVIFDAGQVAPPLTYTYTTPTPEQIIEATTIIESPAEPTIIVHIAGAVNIPGVYEMPEGVRINDVLQAAGGASPYADLTRINLAAFAQDAMQIIIPTIGEELPPVFATENVTNTGGITSGINASGLVNVNTANLTELQTLPGIGPVLAQNIIDFRETHGQFATIDELIHVSRIGAATLERLRPLVTV